ncbi:AtpZ/AtpI family protein [Oricola sp.]|uniref:AtpZ/AtpI family protein n=1 Tax=Oricola sp. TaxID=1979950 RepID=UPI0025FBBC38|nr:AtpZ/AtpI family protein [Oricola sp.]MCI5076655.1 AtpZ/AtpI family protein [Oricola sp.]
MAGDKSPHKPDEEAGKRAEGGAGAVGDLDSRRAALNAALAERKADDDGQPNRRTGGGAGFANALRLSSEFVAGVLVGAGIGYLIDRIAGIAPWGMIVFLLLGFVAGVLNVLRSAGLVAAPEDKSGSGRKSDGEQN